MDSRRQSRKKRWIALGCVGFCLLAATVGLLLLCLRVLPGRSHGSRIEAEGQLRAIAAALHAYRLRWDELPASAPESIEACATGGGEGASEHAKTGAEALVFWLGGWYVEDGSLVVGEGWRITREDGTSETTPGFLPDPQMGPVAAGSQGVDSELYAGKGRYFVGNGSAGRPILYFRSVVTDTTWNVAERDNGSILRRWRSSDAQLNDWVKARAPYTNTMVRVKSAYMLLNAGPDGLYVTDDDVIYIHQLGCF
jgi:hypothetical protein